MQLAYRYCLGMAGLVACVGACAANTKPQPNLVPSPVGTASALPAASNSSDAKDKKFGRLAPEVIQRIVRSQYGHMRDCYEQGLARDRNLEGTVEVRFVIERDGSVGAIQLTSRTTMPDADVNHCILERYKLIRFPAPEKGIVTVIYPIRFQPGD